MKYRTRGGFDPYPTGPYVVRVEQVKKNSPANIVTTTHANSSIGSSGKIMVDVVTPRYREAIASGAIINNFMQLTENQYSGTPYSGLRSVYTNLRPTAEIFDGDVISATDTWTNLWVNPYDTNFPALGTAYDFSQEEQEVINDAFVKSQQQNVMGLVDTAELGKTLAFLRENLLRAEKLIRGDVRFLYKIKEWKSIQRKKKKATKDGRLSFKYHAKTAAGKLGDASNLYLEYKYGLIPLMGTIEGLIKTAVDAAKPVRNTFRGFSQKNVVDEEEQIVYNTQFGETKPIFRFRLKREIEWVVRAGVMTEFNPGLNDRLGLSLHSLPSALYELVPYSFVLDWIWKIGPAITALTPHPRLQVLASWSTVEKIVTETYTVEFLAVTFQNGTDRIQYYPGKSVLVNTNRYKNRTPGVTPGIPNAKLNFSHFTHLSNGLALILSSFKRTSLARL